ncbi:MAG: 16S rRNA (adenine(1518)-N(6)/adenine(1519)-N(6))-dimethyltransferase RsmA [Bacilli bacterium]|nr:16S rRNA (adenine(1518)-N(6)/adenine(1519)-N(6))-dimethyltransferase RsmA [Bacilli bacterium]
MEEIMEYSPKKLSDILEKHGFNFKKSFGQNFIVDENIIDAIIEKAMIKPNTCVLEIGPGAGALTYKLSERAKNVLCFEIDKKLEPILEELLNEKNNVEIIYEDFLTSDIKTKISSYSFDSLYVVANLPYYITTPIIMKLIEDKIPVDKIVIMVQKEVGDRFKAVPGTKDYSSLSVFLNYYFDVKKLMDVSRHVFLPKPNVDSIIIELKKKECQTQVIDEDYFFKLIRESFKQKRKTIKNNLREYPLNEIEKILKKYGFDLSVRAEQLSLDIFIDIANRVSKGVCSNDK